MSKATFLFAILLITGYTVFSQVAINTDNSPPDPSAMLDVKSTTKGTLVTRMTQAQIIALQNPANGLLVFCTTDNKFYAFIAATSTWKEILFGSGAIHQNCGTPLTINHVAGTVAPVNKTVTYGTVTNIPGEIAKCWITNNLGSDRQATTVSDATEASAGWYWQFNRKQGYKHTGTVRTPNTAWITAINENVDWQSSNDPCALELGGYWRIPTYTEWDNVFYAGGWSNWNGPWNSPLKLHASGRLEASYLGGGGLFDRGAYGYYWSSTQNTTVNGSNLIFLNTNCYMYFDPKSYGYALRCIRN